MPAIFDMILNFPLENLFAIESELQRIGVINNSNVKEAARAIFINECEIREIMSIEMREAVVAFVQDVSLQCEKGKNHRAGGDEIIPAIINLLPLDQLQNLEKRINLLISLAGNSGIYAFSLLSIAQAIHLYKLQHPQISVVSEVVPTNPVITAKVKAISTDFQKVKFCYDLERDCLTCKQKIVPHSPDYQIIDQLQSILRDKNLSVNERIELFRKRFYSNQLKLERGQDNIVLFFIKKIISKLPLVGRFFKSPLPVTGELGEFIESANKKMKK
jgi:hypothetical protein